MLNLKAIPFFKLLLPFVLGIIVVLQFGLPKLHLLFTVISLVSFLLLFFVHKLVFKSNAFKQMVTESAMLFLFTLAFTSAYFYNQLNYKNHYTHFVSQYNNQCIVKVTDVAKRTKTLQIVPVNVEVCLINNNWQTVSGKTLLYLKDTLNNYDVGQTLLVNQKFTSITKPKNPNEFDYYTFLKRKNIFNVVFANNKQCFKINTIDNAFTLQQLGGNIKQVVLQKLKQLQLSQQAYSISAALLVGYDDEIDSDIIQQFSHSGTLHVLSVSGMHTGVVYTVILFLFSLFDKHNNYKKLKCAVVLCVLWLLVAITGFSPSIMRAAVMLSLMIVGKTFYKDGNAFNTLFISAFVLLLFNPYLIIDVGFLLSYFAVFGILYLYPIIYNKLYFENIVLRYLWASTVISVCATLFTLPITLYFFHQFPIWFIVSNLIIIPLSMVLLFSSLLAIVFVKISFVTSLLVYISNASTQLMLWFAKLTDNANYGFIDNIKFTAVDVLFLSALLFVVFIVINTKSVKSVYACCSIIVLWFGYTIYEFLNQHQKNELVIYSIKNKSAFSIAQGNSVIVYQNNVTSNEFNRHIKPHVVNYNYKTDSINPNAIMLPNKTVLLRNNHTIKFENLKNNITTIVADCSNNYKFVAHLKKQCTKHNLMFYYIKEKGAFMTNI